MRVDARQADTKEEPPLTSKSSSFERLTSIYNRPTGSWRVLNRDASRGLPCVRHNPSSKRNDVVESMQPRRWPAYLMTVMLLGYALAKVVFAMQTRLGFPSGLPTAEHIVLLKAEIAQRLVAGGAVIGAGLSLVSATKIGRRAPRTVMLPALALMALSVGAGAVVVVLDAFIDLGIGWRWYHGAVGLVAIGLCAALIHSYIKATQRHHVR